MPGTLVRRYGAMNEVGHEDTLRLWTSRRFDLYYFDVLGSAHGKTRVGTWKIVGSTVRLTERGQDEPQVFEIVMAEGGIKLVASPGNIKLFARDFLATAHRDRGGAFVLGGELR